MQSVRFQRIPVENLLIGMFVAELDKPWLDSPFLIQGFILEEAEQLEALRNECRFVTIDTGKSEPGKYASTGVHSTTPKKNSAKQATSTARSHKKNTQPASLGKSLAQTFADTRLKKYSDTRSFDQEVKSAKRIYQDYESSVAKLYSGFQKSKAIDVKAAKEAVSGIVESMIRNPDACLLLQQIKRKGDYHYNHAIGTSIWSTALARQIGLPKDKMNTIALAALLCDIGKTAISDRILHKPGELSPEEFNLVKGHVLAAEEDDGDENLQGLSNEVKDIILHHHERHDGSGYPDGLQGDDIPVFARVVGIADAYDAMTSRRPYAAAMAPYEASRELYKLRDTEFQAEIVEEFIQTLGLYPVGTLVELNDGRVGIVVSEYRASRLRPKLLIVLDKEKQPVKEPFYLNLSKPEHSQAEISRSLESGAFGLDPDEFFL